MSGVRLYGQENDYKMKLKRGKFPFIKKWQRHNYALILIIRNRSRHLADSRRDDVKLKPKIPEEGDHNFDKDYPSFMFVF